MYATLSRLHSLWTYLPYSLQVTQGIADDIQVLVLLVGLPPHLKPILICMHTAKLASRLHKTCTGSFFWTFF